VAQIVAAQWRRFVLLRRTADLAAGQRRRVLLRAGLEALGTAAAQARGRACRELCTSGAVLCTLHVTLLGRSGLPARARARSRVCTHAAHAGALGARGASHACLLLAQCPALPEVHGTDPRLHCRLTHHDSAALLQGRLAWRRAAIWDAQHGSRRLAACLRSWAALAAMRAALRELEHTAVAAASRGLAARALAIWRRRCAERARPPGSWC